MKSTISLIAFALLFSAGTCLTATPTTALPQPPVDVPNCNNDTTGWRTKFGEVSFASSQEWQITNGTITQIWSDAVTATNCQKEAFNPGAVGNYFSDCRSNPGQKGDLFSWCAVARFGATLCPAPWRVPTIQDISNLDIVIRGSGDGTVGYRNPEVRDRYLANHGMVGRFWGGAYGGACTPTDIGFQGRIAHYWTSSEFSDIRGHLLTFSASEHVYMLDYHDKGLLGAALRCIRDSEAGFVQRGTPFIISGTWEREGNVNEISLYRAVSGRLTRIATADLQSDKTFKFAYVPQDKESFYVIGTGNPAERTNKYTFYLKAGDQLNLAVNNTGFTLRGENTAENKVMAAWHNHTHPLTDKPFAAEKTGNSLFDAQFAKYREFDLMHLAAPNYRRISNVERFLSNADILMFPYGIALLQNILFSESGLSAERLADSVMLLLGTVQSDTLKGELFITHVLPRITDFSRFQELTEQYEKYVITDDQKRRFDRESDVLKRRFSEETSRANRARLERAQAENRPAEGISFTYLDVNDQPVSLSDFKGKIVYVDTWATWCGPCRAQIPHIKRLKEHFKDREDLVIIGISIDRPTDIMKWKDFVAKEKPENSIQLWGGMAGPENFQTKYGIRAIPHFLIFDKEGNIVNADAPAPSSAEIIPLLTRLLE